MSAVAEDRILDLQEQAVFAHARTGLSEAVEEILATGGVSLAFQPYRDDEVLPADVEESLLAGTASGVPLLMGSTAHEFTAAGPMFAPLLATGDLAATLERGPLGPAAADYRGHLRRPSRRPGVDFWPADHRRHIPAPAGPAGRAAGDPTWLYDFRLVHRDTGLSGHCADLPFAWDLLDAPQVTAVVRP